MPVINGQRVLNTDARYTNTLNARGGIDKTSQAELAGTRPQGSTGTVNALQVAPRLNPTIPDVIPSTALAGNKTFEDVMDTRADLETQATAKQRLNDRIKGTGDRIGASSTPTFNDPDAIINRLLLNRVPTQTETQRTQAFDTAQQTRRDYATEISTARTQANAQFGVPDLVARKAGVTQQYAEREAQLDADIKRIEANASKRGVDRAAVEDMKRATKSAALEDLANYAAIEAAVSGSITEARTIINDTINDKKAAFELENQAIQQEIDYLSTLVGEENQREASQLQFALNERKRLQDAQLAKEKEIKEYAAEVAAEGADDGTIQAILKAGTSEEALRYAAPFLGKTARRQAEANIANSYSQINSRALNDTIALAEKGDQKAIDELGFDPRKSTGNFEAESNLRKEFNALPTVKEAVNVQQSYKSINSALTEAQNAVKRGGSPAAADQALIISFNKMLDPTSVVREGEFARSTQGQAILDQLQAKVDAAMRGGAGLTDQMRQEIVNTTNVLYGDYVRTHNDNAYEFRQNAIRQGADPKYVAGYIDTTARPDEAQDGDILVINGIPMEKQGNEFIPLDI